MRRRGRRRNTRSWSAASSRVSDVELVSFLHTVTKPTAGRGRVQILEEENEDVRSLARCEEKKTEWAEHWQHNTDVQDLKDKPWRNEELKCLEEGMPRLKEGEKAGRN